jgi:hypothetical protein
VTISTVATLQDFVESYLERTLDDSLFLQFLQNVHSKLHRGVMGADGRTWVVPPLRHRCMLTTGTLTTSGGSVALSGLTRWLEFERLWIDQNYHPGLKYHPLATFRDMTDASQSGTPELYTIDGATLYVAPTSDAEINVSYYQHFEELTADGDTNALFTTAPNAYLHGALAEAFRWSRNAQRQAEEDALFAAVIRALNDEKSQAQTSGSPLIGRVGAVA